MIDPWTKGDIKHIKNRRFIEPSVLHIIQVYITN